MMWSRFVMSQVKHNSYFLCGVTLGLWLSLAAIPMDEETAVCGAAGGAGGAGPAPLDEYSPAREERPLGPGPPPAGRSVQRPRYYTTELGMRGSVLTGVLSSAEALAEGRVAALNHTLQRLQPALKYFITASAVSAAPGLANVVGFTDTREMLKPFHALKYLADNYLEEYDFFFLVSDAAFVNARHLQRLVSKLSVSQELYLGAVAEDDSHYCSLESGILLSNSVLRAVHGELDWCVRNSYSPHHHENLGRCVLHAAHLSCADHHQGESYLSVRLQADADEDAALRPELADALTVHPASPRAMHRLHAYASRVSLERGRAEALRLRAALWRLSARHPPHARNASWPAGLRADPGLLPPPPDSRFDHIRWTLFNASHAFMPDEQRAAAPLAGSAREAVLGALRGAQAWARARWPEARGAELVEGAWQWDPPAALRYRLLLRLSAGEGARLVQLEAARALGAARLVPVRYVTESARVSLLLPLPPTATALADAAGFLDRYRRLIAQRDSNTHLYIVAFRPGGAAGDHLAPLRTALGALAGAATLLEAEADAELAQAEAEGEVALYALAGRLAVRAARAGGALSEDALIFLAVPHLEFNQDFLNRVRMNTVRGTQWFAALPFSRMAHARAPRPRAGRFNARAHLLAAFYRDDYDAAEAEWRGSAAAGVCEVLGAARALRALRAPDPAALLPPRPRPAPCRPARADGCRPALDTLDLGARSALAQLLLETQLADE